LEVVMEATTKDLRLHTRELIAATDRGEEVIITYRGKRRAKLIPCDLPAAEQEEPPEHNPLFGLWRDKASDVDADVRALRASRTFDAD
jgi:prevent-host-death family protein